MSTAQTLDYTHATMGLIETVVWILNQMRVKNREPNSDYTASAGGLHTVPALEWLIHDPQGASVLATARQLLEIEAVLHRALPAALGSSCKAARLHQAVLTVAVPGAAHASKLRHLGPRIIEALNQAGWNITEVTIRVQAEQAPTVAAARPRGAALGETGIEAFTSLRTQLEAGPLLEAVNRLLERHQ